VLFLFPFLLLPITPQCLASSPAASKHTVVGAVGNKLGAVPQSPKNVAILKAPVSVVLRLTQSLYCWLVTRE
jgi:hypothetical protein